MASQFNKKSKLALVTNEGPDELNEHLREWIRHTNYDSELNPHLCLDCVGYSSKVKRNTTDQLLWNCSNTINEKSQVLS